MTDHKVSEFVFKKSDHVVTPASKNAVKDTSDLVSVDPLLLLQQFIVVGHDSESWQMCLSMNIVFNLQHHLRQLEPCSNPAKHLKQIH